ncbi:hypothetical protein NDU88_003957 [Pleurodeles waltl]|uniref:Uncharacterized protein n=1 Tax=Pleurodeles waltl TaxID=8319 RepID=A0AAV7LK10_PLEWA|nr:hypothetical protein NDU88_003957 [Pleurodeles waltl]
MRHSSSCSHWELPFIVLMPPETLLQRPPSALLCLLLPRYLNFHLRICPLYPAPRATPQHPVRFRTTQSPPQVPVLSRIAPRPVRLPLFNVLSGPSHVLPFLRCTSRSSGTRRVLSLPPLVSRSRACCFLYPSPSLYLSAPSMRLVPRLDLLFLTCASPGLP